MLDGDHSDAEGVGHRYGGGHTSMRGEEAEAVVPVYLGNDGCDVGKGWGAGGREDAGSDAGYVGGETVDAVAVDAAKVGEDKGAGDDCGVFGRDAVADEEGICKCLCRC